MGGEPNQVSLSLLFFRLLFSFSFSSRLSVSLPRSLLPEVAPLLREFAPIGASTRLYAWAVRACACSRRVRRVAVPKEPREYVSILEGVAGGAETAPALATLFLATTSRSSSNPRCNPNERCSLFPHLLTSHPLGLPRSPSVFPPPPWLSRPPSIATRIALLTN